VTASESTLEAGEWDNMLKWRARGMGEIWLGESSWARRENRTSTQGFLIICNESNDNGELDKIFPTATCKAEFSHNKP
jgi:hypothetical protein